MHHYEDSTVFPRRNAVTKILIMFGLALFAASHPWAAGSLLEEANAMYNAGKMAEAVKLYKKAAIEGENPALCYFNAANALFQTDSLARALVYYKACTNVAPDFFKAYLNLAVVYYSLNDMGNCIAIMRHGLELSPGHQKGMLILAAAYRSAGAIAQSIAVFEDLARAYPDMEEPYIALGQMYRDLEDPELAAKWLMAYPATGKNLAYVSMELTDVFESTGDLMRAAYYLEQAYSIDNSKKWALCRLAQLQQKMGNDLVALETAREGMERFTDFPDIALVAGNIAFSHGWFGEAERCFSSAAKHGSAQAVIGLGNVRGALKNQAGQPDK
jgi:tetratricopeptide (TPR) repeat protein